MMYLLTCDYCVYLCTVVVVALAVVVMVLVVAHEHEQAQAGGNARVVVTVQWEMRRLCVVVMLYSPLESRALVRSFDVCACVQ